MNIQFVVKSSIVWSSSGKSHEGALLVAKTATVRTFFFFAKIAKSWVLISHHVSPKYEHTKIIDTLINAYLIHEVPLFFCKFLFIYVYSGQLEIVILKGGEL